MMIKSLLISVAAVICLSASAVAQKGVWAQHAGGSSSERPFALASDNDGNVYVTGAFQHGATFGKKALSPSGDTDAFLAKYDSEGKVQWVRKGGSTYWENNTLSEYGIDVAVVNDKYVYITGTFRRTATFEEQEITSAGQDDIFVAKYSLEGRLIWVRSAGGISQDKPQALASDEEGNVYLTGYFQHTATFGKKMMSALNSSECFVAKYTPEGEVDWVNHSASKQYAVGKAISYQNGHLYVGGEFEEALEANRRTLSANGSTDIFVAQYDTNGQLSWIKSIGGEGKEKISSITTDSKYLYFTGSFEGHLKEKKIKIDSEGESDMLLGKYSLQGEPLWLTKAGGVKADQGNSIALDEGGNVLLVGSFQDRASITADAMYSHGFTDIFVASYSDQGKLQWQDVIGGSGQDLGADILSFKSDIVLAGSFRETAALGQEEVSSAGASDILLTKEISPNQGAVLATGNTNYISAHPNPVSDVLYISANIPNFKRGVLRITNSVGVSLANYRFGSGVINKKIDVTKYTSGVYYVQVFTEGKTFSEKVIIR